VNISLGNRNSEILIGLKNDAPRGISIKAVLLIFHYFFRGLHFNKLTAHIFEDNKLSLSSAKHIGFKEEGVMRKHALDPRSKTYVDIHLLSILNNEFENNLNKRLIKRYFTAKA